jgi:hypothetical protein
MGSAVDRLVALSGPVHVGGYTRKDGTKVSAYTRAPGSMADGELFKEFTDLATKKGIANSGLNPQAATNRRQQVLTEIRKREKAGTWNPPDVPDADAQKVADGKAPATPNPHQRPVSERTREQFEKNKAEPQADLTDEEYEAHVAKIEAIITDPANAKYETQSRYSTVDADGNRAYTPERQAQHEAIIQDILAKHADVPTERKAVMSGGLGGAGKGYVLEGHADIPESDYITIDPDQMKQELLSRGMVEQIEGLLPLEHAAFIHEESSDLANMLHQVAMDKGMNIVLDTTMAAKKPPANPEDGVMKKIKKFQDAGYSLEAVFVDVPVSLSKESALGRHKGGVNRFRQGIDKGRGDLGGRFVPRAYLEGAAPEPGSPYQSANRGVFEILKDKGIFTRARVFDNSDRSPGAVPKLISDTMEKVASAKKAKDNGPDGTKTTASAKKDKKVALSAVQVLMRKTRS